MAVQAESGPLYNIPDNIEAPTAEEGGRHEPLIISAVEANPDELALGKQTWVFAALREASFDMRVATRPGLGKMINRLGLSLTKRALQREETEARLAIAEAYGTGKPVSETELLRERGV